MFDNIAADDARLEDVREFVRVSLATADEKFVRKLYVAFRAWSWKALNSRRRDDELRGWYELLRRVSSYWRSGHQAYADRMVTLYELVFESISVSDRLSPDEVAGRDHVRDILALLSGSHGHRMERSELLGKLGIKQANMTRVLNMVEATGLIEKERMGKRSIVGLTVEGISACDRLGISGDRRTSVTDTAELEKASGQYLVLPSVFLYGGSAPDVAPAILSGSPRGVPVQPFCGVYDVHTVGMHGAAPDRDRPQFEGASTLRMATLAKPSARMNLVRDETRMSPASAATEREAVHA